MNEEQLFAAAFNEEAIGNAQALPETQSEVEATQANEDFEVAPYVAPAVDEPPLQQQESESQQQSNWYDSVPAEARKQLDPILQDWRSNHGRVSALTKKTLEQEARIAELQAQFEAQQQAKPEEAPAEVMNPIDVLKDEFPELGNSVEQAMAYERQRLQAEFEQKLSPYEQMRIEQQQRIEALQRQEGLNRVGQAHPDWQQVVVAPVFQQWLGQQPKAVKEILQDSQDPSENIWLLSQFKRDMALANQQRQVQTQAKSQRLAQSAGVKQTGKPIGETDPDALFAFAYQNA